MNLLTLSDGRTFSDMETYDQNPCLTCGACCTHFRISFYGGETDAHPYGFVPDSMVVNLTGTIVCMRGTEHAPTGRCTALTGEVGKSIACTIYENRPTPCREYHVWDQEGTPNPKCQELRAKHGIPLLQPKKEI